MNKHDRENYEYIMSLTPQEFESWYATISDDDAEYALELIKMARTELIEHSHILCDDVETVTEAQDVLKQFTLGNKIQSKK